MNPITFTCQARLSVPKSEIFNTFTDLDAWKSFGGYGPLPGIKKAVYEVKTEETEGTIIRAFNTDGSTHKEKILTWRPPDSLVVKLYDFPPPLSCFSSHFIERWTFEEKNKSEIVLRTMELHPNNAFKKPLVWVISKILQKAIIRHLEKITSGEDTQ